MTLSEPQKPAQFPSAGVFGLGDKQRRWRLPDKAADRRDIVGVFGVDKLLVDASKLLFRRGRKDLSSVRMGWADSDQRGNQDGAGGHPSLSGLSHGFALSGEVRSPTMLHDIANLDNRTKV